jgi:lipopolysaccharide export system protein LptC
MGIRGRIGTTALGHKTLSTISFADAEGRIALPKRSRGDNERLYRRALRHSRFVRVLRVGLVGAIVLVLATLVVIDYMPLGGVRLPAGIATTVIHGTKITMQHPRLTGYTADGRAYEFSAHAAAQDITKPDVVQLERIRANIQMADKSTVNMWADTGTYDMKSDMLALNDNIRLVSSTGYQARLQHALVNVRKGSVVSDTPVWVKLLDGDLNAKHLEITDKGEVLRFTHVTMVLQTDKQDAKAGRP